MVTISIVTTRSFTSLIPTFYLHIEGKGLKNENLSLQRENHDFAEQPSIELTTNIMIQGKRDITTKVFFYISAHSGVQAFVCLITDQKNRSQENKCQPLCNSASTARV